MLGQKDKLKAEYPYLCTKVQKICFFITLSKGCIVFAEILSNYVKDVTHPSSTSRALKVGEAGVNGMFLSEHNA